MRRVSTSLLPEMNRYFATDPDINTNAAGSTSTAKTGDIAATATTVATVTEGQGQPEASGKCLDNCAARKKSWDVKCKWKNRCDACSECSGTSCHPAINKWCAVTNLVFIIGQAVCANTIQLVNLETDEYEYNLYSSIHVRIGSPAPVVTTESEPEASGKCLDNCAARKKSWDVKCKWKNRCDACSECSGTSCHPAINK